MYKQKIAIIDYDVGNTFSVSNAIKFLGYHKVKITADEKEIANADALILPGVGAFDEAVKNLRAKNLDNILETQVIAKKKPILGICVGMQMLASYSEENGKHEGLNWIKGKVVKLQLPAEYAVPHVGWNDVEIKSRHPLLASGDKKLNYYFDHSYHFVCDEKFVSAYTRYGINITAAVQYKNIFGVQFHPEKSQTNGLKLFRRFFNSI